MAISVDHGTKSLKHSKASESAVFRESQVRGDFSLMPWIMNTQERELLIPRSAYHVIFCCSYSEPSLGRCTQFPATHKINRSPG